LKFAEQTKKSKEKAGRRKERKKERQDPHAGNPDWFLVLLPMPLLKWRSLKFGRRKRKREVGSYPPEGREGYIYIPP
jgi:hypothetical protein